MLKKYELGIWIKVPCVNQMGSCIYKDLCIHSIPANSSCPRQFINNNIPCRCPIPKGNYTIPTVQLQMDYWSLSSIYTGKYWARVISANKGDNLACYEVYFNIYDNMSNLGSVPYFDDNALDPIVELVD
ncbi:hypothetical protein NQ317_004520 [Molorchus minor]|uniref:Ganglioside GM2 activator n=1 Tax=Molorchus minor TaxID=1323400 RepID=A0ABQ9JXN3_9CUCU|nr:hypothetical protein NQ317_004520 [Molorchus minor]